MNTTFTIKSINARQAQVTNDQTLESVIVKVEPYHRAGKQMAYVVINKELNAPITRYNVADYTKPIDLKSVSMNERSRSGESFDFSNFKF